MMCSSSNEKSENIVSLAPEHDLYGPVKSECHENHVDTDDEDEDMDFNPFLKETPSPEASSVLDSESESLDGGVVESERNRYELFDFNSLKHTTNCPIEDSEPGEEEILMHSKACTEGTCAKELEKIEYRSPKKKPDDRFVAEKDNGSISRNDVNYSLVGDLSNTINSYKPMLNLDDNDADAIWKRTRARYSLASFTLDELETFLQETDDDEDLQNFDDEEEYRKFLAVVLLGKDDDNESIIGNKDVDDDDEDNDADFEIELEEALESDLDESARDKTQNMEHDIAGRRPETRQNRRQKASTQHKNRLIGHAKRPLRPLLPVFPSNSIASPLLLDGKRLIPETTPSSRSSRAEDCYINGFSSHQIGQLHCLIHEHVQLLIQTFSLCVLDPSRKHIASQVEGLVSEVLQKRDQVIACKNAYYPGFCFGSPYVCPSASQQISSSTEGALRVPCVNGPVVSILDVAPLSLFEKYKDNVYTAVREYQRRNVELSFDSLSEREPLFPLPRPTSVDKDNCHDNASTSSNQSAKMTFAAAVVESTKKQSVALVPKEIAKLAQMFSPLFNPALFPHKPPPPSVANRFLFTASEDELLALGLMEYNTDWEAIQQRFLPCKSKHQIFVRQKNRCSSKAPDNCIKAVRRMKTSPLTAKEIECIQEGLRIFNLDWMSIWKFCVPHRDPSLLPRQWRTALGIQRSYKHDDAEKEKRRIYEAKRRMKSAALANWKNLDGKKDCQEGEDCSNADEAYVHEAFLADWRPGNYLTSNIMSQAHGRFNEKTNNYEYGSKDGIVSEFQPVSKCSQHPSTSSHFNHFRYSAPYTFEENHALTHMNTSKSISSQRRYRGRRNNNAHIVKLAPGLPPVNLPPSVRVISQSAFQRDSGAPTVSSTYKRGTDGATVENIVPPVAKQGTTCSIKIIQDKSDLIKDRLTNSSSEGSRIVKDNCTVEERGTDSDLHMHPLLFQAPEDGHQIYCASNRSTSTSNSFSFFSGNQPQLNLSLFHNPLQGNSVNKSFPMPCGIDFHPLLQSDEVDNDSIRACSTAQLSVGLEGKSAQLKSPFFDPVRYELLADSGDPPVPHAVPAIPKGKATDLDLEIYLSSVSGKEKGSGDKDVAAHNPISSTLSIPDSGATLETQIINNLCYPQEQGENASLVGSKLVSDAHAHAHVVPSNNVHTYVIVDTDEQSHPEIVMEQEELSDSDEEIEEHVEFECEEMADSEGEDSGSEETAELQNKVKKSAIGHVLTDDYDSVDKHSKENQGHPQEENACSTSNPPVKMYLVGDGTETTSRSWLSLDSNGPDFSLQAKRKQDEDKINLNAASGNRRLCKRTNTNIVLGQKQTINMAEQLSLSSAAVPVLKKPRKHVGRTSRNINKGSDVKRSTCDDRV